jgi:tRNA threonylcarbamoyladenosine biosynthesis protein TsaE
LWRVKTKSAEETLSIGRILGQLLEEGHVVCLSGDLGAGKTTLVKGIALGLGVKEVATSPSFVLVHEYPGRLPLFHLDLYRLEPEAVQELGVAEYLGRGVCVIEWPENLGVLLPREHLWIRMEMGEDEDERLIYLKAKGHRYQSLLKRLKGRCAS